jgi:phosphatidylglycerol---prolipoprotein diacylglyceryl transferase
MPTFQIDPVIFSLGPLQVRWYGLMYVVGFVVGSYLLRVLVKDGFFQVAKQKVDSLVTYILIGMFIGARTVYVFVYNWDQYSGSLGDIFAVWKGGLSFHGAIAGMALGALIFARRNKLPLAQVTDSMVIAGAQGIFFGRMGNFINGELFGRVTDSPFGMVFLHGGPYPRHPSQLYEGIGEGIILWLILFLTRKKYKYYGVPTTIFLAGYAVIRYCIEFFREADAQLGYYFGGTTTMGQILCIIMLFVSLAVFLYVRKNRERLAIDLEKRKREMEEESKAEEAVTSS